MGKSIRPLKMNKQRERVFIENEISYDIKLDAK